MLELNLTLSEKFNMDYAENIQADLSKYLKVSKPNIMFLRSADPTLTSFVQLLGDVKVWLPLGTAAAAYLSTLAKRAAEATWDKFFNSNEVKPIADVATTLATAAVARGWGG